MNGHRPEMTQERFLAVALDLVSLAFADLTDLNEVLTVAVALGSMPEEMFDLDGLGDHPAYRESVRIDAIAYAAAVRLSDLGYIGPLRLVVR